MLFVQITDSSKGVLIVYFYQLFISVLILCIIKSHSRVHAHFENSFALVSSKKKRVDSHVEQIALSDRSAIDIERT
jgi:hypothetical protein